MTGRWTPFANPQRDAVCPVREWIGSAMPPGRAGFVVEDIDALVIRRYGDRYDQDATGCFRLCEYKYRPDLATWLDAAQLRTFDLLEEQCHLGDLCRVADDKPGRFGGYWVIAYDEPEPGPSTRWAVRRIGEEGSRVGPMAWPDMAAWLHDG